jgi:hypothetical protein
MPWRVAVYALFVAHLLGKTAHCQSIIYLSDFPDSVTLVKNNRTVAVVSWSANAVVGLNDNIVVMVGDYYESPACASGENIALNYPLIMYPVNADALTFKPYSVHIRMYGNDEKYTLDDFSIPNNGSYGFPFAPVRLYAKYGASSAYQMEYPQVSADKVEFYPNLIQRQTKLSLVAHNVLAGYVGRGHLFDVSEGPLFVAKRDTCLLSEGVSIDTTLVVLGRLTCAGKPNDSVKVRNAFLCTRPLSNVGDVTLDNSITYSNLSTLVVTKCRARIEKTRAMSVQCSDTGGCLYATEAKIDRLSVTSARGIFKACSLGVGGTVSCDGAMLHIENSYVGAQNGGPCEWQNSYVYLKNNTITTAGEANATCSYPQKALIIAEGNTFADPCSSLCGIGLMIEGGSYGIVRNNVFKNYIAGVETDGEARAVVYNNTFYNCKENGYRNSGGYVKASIVNNIFFNNVNNRGFTPISFQNFMVNNGSEFWLDRNIWFHPMEPTYNWSTPYIGSPENAVIYGNSAGMNCDPLFLDTEDCRLIGTSPAIDSGLKAIKAFEFTYAILDTVLTMPDTIYINQYAGVSPDIGAHEYGVVSSIRNKNSRRDGVRLLKPLISCAGERIFFYLSIPPDHPQTDIAKLTIFDARGRLVSQRSIHFPPDASEIRIDINRRQLASGRYFAEMIIGDAVVLTAVTNF